MASEEAPVCFPYNFFSIRMWKNYIAAAAAASIPNLMKDTRYDKYRMKNILSSGPTLKYNMLCRQGLQGRLIYTWIHNLLIANWKERKQRDLLGDYWAIYTALYWTRNRRKSVYLFISLITLLVWKKLFFIYAFTYLELLSKPINVFTLKAVWK
jgi:hypothetical protein